MTRDADKTKLYMKDDKQAGGQRAPKGGNPGPYRDPPGRPLAPSMFRNFDESKNRKLPGWAVPLLGGAIFIHVVIFTTMWVKTIWDIEQLERPKNSIDLAVAPPPPPPPPPPKGGAKPQDVKITPKKVRVRDIVQPVKIEKQEAVAPPDPGVEGGEEGGEADGQVGGEIGGVVAAPPPPPPPPPPAPPQTVAPTALDANRIAGEKNIVPDDMTKNEISRSGRDRLTGTYKLCITAEGNISSVTQLKSTTFQSYDSKIINTIRGEWRYRPFMVNGKATPVCTAVTFIYTQK